MEHSFSQYMPHGHCFLWQPDLLGLHVISDAIIVMSYFSIPFSILYFTKKKKIGSRLIPGLFIAFILSCGVTHLFTIWNFWHGDYWLSGVFKAICASVSGYAAITFWYLMPQALKLPTTKEMADLNKELQAANSDLNEKVDIRTKDLRDANKNLMQFNHFLSHDLKNSAGIVVGFSDLIKSNQNLDEISKYNEIINRSAHQIIRFIDDLNKLVNLQREDLVVESIDLQEMMENIKGEFHENLHGISGELKASNLPTIYCVESLIQHLFSNLLTNSIKYRSTERNLQIEVSYHESPDSHVIHWKDNGVGVPKEMRNKVFELFYKGHATAADGLSSSGIGLAFCKRIIDLHKGDISLDPNFDEKQGTLFVIKIPKDLNQQNLNYSS